MPAPSVHDPVTFASPLSGPLYVPEVQEPIPTDRRRRRTRHPTGLVYQPFESGDLAKDASTDGGLESLATVTVYDLPSGPYWRAHVTAEPAVSSVIVVGPQPGDVSPAGSYDQLTVTFDLNQPPHPPPLHAGAGVEAADPTFGPMSVARTARSAMPRIRIGLTRSERDGGRRCPRRGRPRPRPRAGAPRLRALRSDPGRRRRTRA